VNLFRQINIDGYVVSQQTMTQQYTMPRKRLGSGLAKIRKKSAKKEQIPSSPPAEELILPGDVSDDEQESLPVEDFSINNDNTHSILQAASTRSGPIRKRLYPRN
jgi:hypothetical protein